MWCWSHQKQNENARNILARPNLRDTEAPGTSHYSKEATVKMYHREPGLINATQLSPSDGKPGNLCPHSHSLVQTETGMVSSVKCVYRGCVAGHQHGGQTEVCRGRNRRLGRCVEKNKKVAHSNSGHLHGNDMQVGLGTGRGP